MKRYFFTFAWLFIFTAALSQNVGIGTTAPQKLLSVNGSVLIDQGNANPGTLDSAALRFGTTAGVGITSSRVGTLSTLNGLDFWTQNLRRMTINSSGFVGINTTSPVYRLDVNGTIRGLNLYSLGEFSTEYNAHIGGSTTINEHLGIGASYSSSYRLYVNGNALINTNLGVNGSARVDGPTNLNNTLTVDGKITNDGKAIMLSNSGTTLRSGFTKGAFGVVLAAGASTSVEFCIPKFTGNNDNVRVMSAQFVPGTGNSNAGCFIFTPMNTDQSSTACGGNSSVFVRITNGCANSANTGTNAVLHLFVVVTN
ncbi:MAG: hypothetical protein EOO14_09000 [Chitinophagaceae bacterium]|nr:MAG: hypothetical protein EOO14_09000 [Chitinophagaceae bacterium]